MILFAVVIGMLLLLALGLMFHGVFGSQSKNRIDHQRMNVELAKEQLSQVKELHRQKLIDDAELATSRAEIENNLAMNLQGSSVSEEKHKTAWWEKSAMLVIGPAVAALAIFMYFELGEMRALDAEFVAAMSAQNSSASNASSGQQAAGAGEKLPSIDELLPRLEAHLESTPDDARGWSLLGTTYLRMQRYGDAEQALARALELLPDNPDVMLQLADTKAMLGAGVMKGEPEALVDRALRIVPDDARALWLKGMASEQSGDMAGAIARWQQLLPQLEGDPESLSRMQNMIADAKSKIVANGGSAQQNDPTLVPQAAASNETGSANSKALEVLVSLSDEIAESVSAETLVYVYAKASQGPPMPLAVVRKSVADLPFQVTLDDSMAMMPQLKLSSFDSVTIGARVSLTGNPVAQSGDFFAEISNVSRLGNETVNVVIDSIVK